MLDAMSSDEKRGPLRRRRAIKRPQMSPGPLADLKALLYELYLQAGPPTLDEIVKWIVADQEATGSPGRDTVARIIGRTGMPPSQADVTTVATVLARAARWDPQDAARRARDLWVAARMASTSPLAPKNPAIQADPRRLDDEHLRHLRAKTYIDMLQYQGGGMMEDPPDAATAQEWAVRDELTARAKLFASGRSVGSMAKVGPSPSRAKPLRGRRVATVGL
jgi:hypothetical protein